MKKYLGVKLGGFSDDLYIRIKERLVLYVILRFMVNVNKINGGNFY